MKKILLASLACTALLLGACKEEKEKVVEEVVEVDFTEATSNYKADFMPMMTSFVEDATLLKTHIEEGKLEEAQKLYPLVHMYVERMKPLTNQFEKELLAIDGVADEEKAAESGGMHAIEYALFKEQDTANATATAQKLVDDVTLFTSTLAKETLDGKAILKSASTMLDQAINDKLLGNEVNLANAQIYDIQANLEAIHLIINTFNKHTTEQEEMLVTEALVEAFEAVAFYEVGKEDYVNYSFFTNTQKQELVDRMKQLNDAFKDYTTKLK